MSIYHNLYIYLVIINEKATLTDAAKGKGTPA